jgi:hypothetical protein
LRFSHANIRALRGFACSAARVDGKMQSLVSTCDDATNHMIANRQPLSNRATGFAPRHGAMRCGATLQIRAVLPVSGGRQAT